MSIFGLSGFTKIALDIGQPIRGAKTPVAMTVTVKSKLIEFRRAVLWLRCTEEVEIPNYKIPEKKDAEGKVVEKERIVNILEKTILLNDKEFTLASSGQMGEEASHAVKGEIDFPADLPASYKGKFAKIKWEAMAGLDMSGLGDPDSGWLEITVK